MVKTKVEKLAEDGTVKVPASMHAQDQVDRIRINQLQWMRKMDRGEKDGSFDIVMRGVEPGDFHFVLSTWMQSYRVAVKHIKTDEYFKGQQNLIAEIAKRRQLVVACQKDQPEYIYGYVCGQLFEDHRVLIDYVYVKKTYRERGVAQSLLAALGYQPETGAIVTHVTPAVRDYVVAHNLEYNPYYNCIGYSDV